ncbi:MAG: hypothetical protein IKU09_10710 [Firmicutes bacterium]|nr:hypothetical protein [Bacillota bacterium]
MYDEIKRIFAEKNIEMSEHEIGLYANMFKVITEFTSNKLSVEDIFTSYDFLSDLLFDRRPEFAIHVKKEDRIRVQLRAMEVLEETKGKLTWEEKEKYAFCVYYANCVGIYDEESGETYNGLVGFTSTEAILEEYKWLKENDPSRFKFICEENDAWGEPFGYSMLNPVLAVSVGASYQYLRRLYIPEHTVEWTRIGSFSNPRGGILDGYEITVTKKLFLRKEVKKYTIYIDPYAEINSVRAPEGFHLY